MAGRHAQAVRVFDRYQRKLARLHRLDPDDRLGRAAELWAAGRRGPFARVRTVLADGFSTLTPFERKLLDALRESADHFWLGLVDDGESRAEAFAGPRQLRAWAEAPVGERTLFNPGPEVITEWVESGERPAGLRDLSPGSCMTNLRTGGGLAAAG